MPYIMKTKCPFKDPAKVNQFMKLVDLYNTKSGHLFTKDGEPSKGNSFSTSFWGGYNGYTVGIFNYSDRESRQTIGYVWYRTGQIIRKSE